MAPVGQKKRSESALLGIGLAICTAIIVIALVGSRFLKSEPPPPPPAAPPPPEKSVTSLLRYSEGYWRGTVEEDAKRYRIAAPSTAALAAPLAYFVDLHGPRRMKPNRDAFDTPHLRLSTRVKKEWATTASGERFRYEHMLLSITNRSSQPIAYRVETAVDHPERCKSKGSLPQNAIALKPGQTISRTECVWQPRATLTVRRIEIIELPELSYFYLSRLVPTQVLIDERTAGGHEPPKSVKTCLFVPWRDIQAAPAGGGGKASWADVMDFYARHNCDEYSYFRGYHLWTEPGRLPSQPPPGVTVAASPSADGGVTSGVH